MRRSGLSRTGRWLVTSFGLGLLRPAPGTWGSMPPVVLMGGLMAVGAAGWVQVVVLCVVAVVFTWVCVLYGDAAEAYFNAKDPSSVCADETAGMCVALLPLTMTIGQWTGSGLGSGVGAMAGLGVAFVAFRLTDIVKAWPAGGLQKLPSGWGVVLDDLVAGVQAGVIVVVAGWVV